MAGGANPPEEPEEAEDWLVTYADAITLLMAFFVMLVSFSKIDLPMFEAVMAGISSEIGLGKEQSPMEILQKSIQDEVYAMQADQVMNVEVDDQGVLIELASGAFFVPGSAQLRPEAEPVVQRIYNMINTEQYIEYAVEVEGHTDDDPIQTRQFPSNWELAAARAARVARYFIDGSGKNERTCHKIPRPQPRELANEGVNCGMHPKRLSVLAFADTRPKVANRDREGNPIKENQEKNRRVSVRVYRMDLDQRASIIKEQGVERFGTEGAGDIPMGNVMERQGRDERFLYLKN